MKSDKIKQLEKELAKEKAKAERLEIKELENKTGLKIGQKVEYIKSETDIDNYHTHYTWHIAILSNLESSGDRVWSRFSYGEQTFTEDIRTYDENNYKLRNSIWGDREVELGEKVQIIVDKPSTTLYKLYEIEKVVKEKGHPITYFYRNDRDSLTPLYEDEFYVTQEKSDY